MADIEIPDNQYALFRMYSSPPFYRRACVITFDGETEDKYRLTQVNLRVCDTGFMGVIHRSMALPQVPHLSVPLKKGQGTARVVGDPVQVGDESHFTLAVESIPDCLSTHPHREAL
jgi:hypothetical protein